jgi:hypothetical protein
MLVLVLRIIIPDIPTEVVPLETSGKRIDGTSQYALKSSQQYRHVLHSQVEHRRIGPSCHVQMERIYRYYLDLKERSTTMIRSI